MKVTYEGMDIELSNLAIGSFSEKFANWLKTINLEQIEAVMKLVQDEAQERIKKIDEDINTYNRIAERAGLLKINKR